MQIPGGSRSFDGVLNMGLIRQLGVTCGSSFLFLDYFWPGLVQGKMDKVRGMAMMIDCDATDWPHLILGMATAASNRRSRTTPVLVQYLLALACLASSPNHHL